MKMNFWKYLTVVLLLLMMTMGAALAEETPLTDFDYALLESRVLLQKYKGTGTAVHVAGSYEIGGTVYGVTLDTATVFRNNTKIISVALGEGIRFATTVNGSLRENSMQGLFQGCQGLVSVDLSKISTKGVTDMSYLFSNCRKLKALDVSGFDTSSVTNLEWLLDYCMSLTSLTGYENWDTGKVENIYKTFNRVSYNYSADAYHDTRLQKIDISKWDLSQVKNSGWCFQNCRVNSILLPDNLATISAGFLNHAAQLEGSSFTVPSGVKKIGYAHTFYDMGGNDLVELKAAGNTCYKAVDGIIYSMDGREMLGIPRAKTFENNTFIIPEGVTFLAELSFSRNNNVHTIVLPNTFEIRQVIPENDPQYIVHEDNGNLNGGNSLSVATYIYTGVTAYGVKADNPRYAAKDGIIYSRDMSELVAVPLRYDQKINVPEGTVKWLKEATSEYASWDTYLKNSTGASIPSTMVEIEQSQIVKLNRMAEKYNTFKITVHEDNPVYYVDEKGLLQERPNVYGARVVLDCDAFTYDGAEKRPVPTVTTNGGTVLTKDADYTVSYLNNVNAGTGIIRIEGTGAYLGKIEIPFTIRPRSITGTPLRLLEQLTWTGEYQTQPFAVDLPDAAWSVSGNKACHVGVYRLTVQGIGNYTDSVSCLYEIAPDTALLDRLNEKNVTQAHLPKLRKIRAMMANANIELADDETCARYAKITQKCEMLISLLVSQRTSQLPETGDTCESALWWGMTLLAGSLLCLLCRTKSRRI